MSASSGDLCAGVLERQSDASATALALVEDSRPEKLDAQAQLLEQLASQTPQKHTVVGITGPPGAGKSTLSGALIRLWVEGKQGVGMIAVDPSSRRSGGALLGDRARLRFEPDEPVFVRSMAARDRLGGLAPATRAACVVLRAAFEWTLIETVGVGQSEVDVSTVSDTVVLVLQPGSGDTLQFMKAGILEIPDILVVHKWDLGALAERTRSDLDAMLRAGAVPRRGSWSPTLLGVSSETREGLPELRAAISEHRGHLERSGRLEAQREEQRVAWALELFQNQYGLRGIEALGGLGACENRVRASGGTGLHAFALLKRELERS